MSGTGLFVDKLTSTSSDAIHLGLEAVLVPTQHRGHGVHLRGHLGNLFEVSVRLKFVRQKLLPVESLHELEQVIRARVRDGPHNLVLLHPAEVVSHLAPHLGLHVVHLLVALPLDGQLVVVAQHEGAVPLVEPLQARVTHKQQLLHELPEPPVLAAPRLPGEGAADPRLQDLVGVEAGVLHRAGPHHGLLGQDEGVGLGGLGGLGLARHGSLGIYFVKIFRFDSPFECITVVRAEMAGTNITVFRYFNNHRGLNSLLGRHIRAANLKRNCID